MNRIVKYLKHLRKHQNNNAIDSWDKLPVGLLKEVHRIVSNKDLDEDEKSLQAAAILNRITYTEMLNMPLDEAKILVANTAFLFEKPKPKKIQKNYNLNGRIYVTMKSLDEMTTAQFIDFNGLINDFDENLPNILSVFLIPKGHKYNDGYDKKQVIKDISDRMMVTEALGLASFFTTAYKRYAMRTLLYSEMVMEAVTKTAPKETKPKIKEMRKALNNLRKEIRSLYGFRL